MPTWRPDPTFYPSPRSAMQAPAETLAYVVRVNPTGDGRPDAIAVVDVDPTSSTYGQLVGEVEMTHAGDELHHFGWNACSSMLCPNAPHPHVERRYLIVPGLGSSRIYVIDTKPDPTQPRIVKTIEPEEVAERDRLRHGHTVHCGPDGIYVSALGAPDGDGPGRHLHARPRHLRRARPLGDRPRRPVPALRLLVAPRLRHDGHQRVGHARTWSRTASSPSCCSTGSTATGCTSGTCGERRHVQTLDLGKEHQMVLELRPAHDPTKAYGFVNTVVSLNDLSASIWLWHRKDGANGATDGWEATKVIDIPAEPADEDQLPPALKPFKAVPPLVTDIDLSVDDQFLYVSCWGTGELKQYDVSDPFNPRRPARCASAASSAGRRIRPPRRPLNGGPQMVEVSRDGRRVYVTNSLYLPWDAQFYPDGIQGWMVKLDADPEGGMSFDPNFFLDFGDQRPHQVRLQGGDASSDSYCFP